MLIKGDNLLPAGIRNILLIQLGDIGDVVLSFPAMRALRENFPQASLVVAVREKARELIEDCPWATDVISINKNKRRWYKEIFYQKAFFDQVRKYHFDIAIDLRTEARGGILAFLSGARLRMGYFTKNEKFWRKRVYTHLHRPEAIPDRHMAELYQSALKDFNIKTEKIWPEHHVPMEKQQFVADLFIKEKIPLDQPIIAVQPFSLWQYKEWGRDKYIQLINWIDMEYKLPIIITGSPDERTRAEEITKMCGQNVYNIAGKTSIGMFTAVLKNCDLFIGGDSSGMHISAAVGTPTVSIFGPASTDAWAPRGEQHRIVHKNLSCVPCNLKGCQGNGISRCLEELTVDEVIPVVKKQIKFLSLKTKHLA